MSEKHPKCQICGVEMLEGLVLKRSKWNGEDLYLCYYCCDLINAVVHDGAYTVFDDISKVMGGSTGKSWEEKLEGWQCEEGEAK